MSSLPDHGAIARPQLGSHLTAARVSEIEALGVALDAARHGQGAVLAVCAPPGRGRSHLLRAAADLARAEGMVVLWAQGRVVERGLPFGVAIQLFERPWQARPALAAAAAPQRDGDRAVDRLLGADAGSAGVSGIGSEDRFAVIRGLHRLARGLAAEPALDGARRGLAIVIDDLHDADEPTLSLLAYLGARLAGEPIAVIVSARPDLPAADPHALAAILRAATVLRPAPLAPMASSELVRRAAPHASDRFCGRCAHATRGNPGLLADLIAELARQGLSGSDGDADRVSELVGEPAIATIEARLSRLPDGAATIARIVAALGDGVSLARAARVARLELDATARAVDALVAAEVLAAELPLAFAAPMVQRALRASLSAAEQAAIEHRDGAGDDPVPAAAPPRPPSAASAIRAVGSGRDDDRVVDDDPQVDARLALARMAMEASLRGEHRQAVVELAQAAWGDGTGPPDTAGQLSALLGGSLLFVDELERALELCSALAPARSDATPASRGPAAVLPRAWSLYHQGRVAQAMAAAQTVLDQPRDAAGPPVDGVYAVVAACRLQLGQLDAAGAVLALLSEPSAVSDVDLPMLFEVRAQLRLAQLRPGDALQDALEAGRRSRSATGVAHPGVLSWRSTAALAHIALDNPARARHLAEEELDLARRAGITRATIRGLHALALVETKRRRLDLLDEAVSIGESCAPRLEYVSALAEYGAALRRANQRTAARKPLGEALERAEQLGLVAIAQRAEHELSTMRARPRQAGPSGPEALTPSEGRVGELAARGMTTREIAATLFVTPKTVEFHLRNVYRKLEVPSSRAELTRALRASTDSATPAVGEPVTARENDAAPMIARRNVHPRRVGR